MGSKATHSIWHILGKILSLFIWLLIFVEIAKWFHRKFGIIGDILLIGFLAYCLYCAPGMPGAHKFEQNKDIPMWKDHWTNKKH